jgi:hypothetical protein
MEQKPDRKYLNLQVDNNKTYEVDDFNLQEFIAAVEKRKPTEALEGGGFTVATPVRVKLYPLPDNSAWLQTQKEKLASFKGALDKEKKEATCDKKKRSKFAHQKVLLAYFDVYNPYHGILIYHGMGSGKTCSSVAMAENLLGNKKNIWVLTPKALKANYMTELMKCSEIYKESQHWEQDRGEWKVTQGEVNFDVLGPKEQQEVRAHLKQMIEKHNAYQFVSFNGMSCQNLRAQFVAEGNPFHTTVVIIDEVHALVELIAQNMKDAASPYSLLYEWLMDAEGCRVIALSGTPRANQLCDLGILFNMLYGYIKVWTVETGKQVEDRRLKRFIYQQQSDGKRLSVTRTPSGFESQYDDNGALVGLKRVDDSWDDHKFKTELSKHGTVKGLEKHKLLPDQNGPFVSKEVFQERINGLTSFFPDLSKLMPTINEPRVHEVALSDLQAKEPHTYALHFPSDVKRISHTPLSPCQTEDPHLLEDIRKTMVMLKERDMFSVAKLSVYGPKLLKVAETTAKTATRQLVYSAALENVFFLAEVLSQQAGFSKLMLSPPNPPEQMSWAALPSSDSRKTFIVYTGEPAELEVYVEAFNKGQARVLLASTAMVEGVSLADVTDVHLLEPSTDMSKLAQVVARARRMCKNTDVTEVTPHVYLSGKHERTVFEHALRRKKEIDVWLEAVKETAIDCRLHSDKCYTGKTKTSESSMTPAKRTRINVEVKGDRRHFYVSKPYGTMQAMYEGKSGDEVYGYITFGPPRVFYKSKDESSETSVAKLFEAAK